MRYTEHINEAVHRCHNVYVKTCKIMLFVNVVLLSIETIVICFRNRKHIVPHFTSNSFNTLEIKENVIKPEKLVSMWPESLIRTAEVDSPFDSNGALQSNGQSVIMNKRMSSMTISCQPMTPRVFCTPEKFTSEVTICGPYQAKSSASSTKQNYCDKSQWMGATRNVDHLFLVLRH